uniref:Uncharacterized protein n=1 Tax=Lactuca sativa TaxID=4236 RepID=A0A9R1WDC4_LACSA|nr:hypothetical protein LSAT_V11C200098130 [Lactuca sativa]
MGCPRKSSIEKGIRQKDLILSFFFIIATEGIRGVKLPRDGPNLVVFFNTWIMQFSREIGLRKILKVNIRKSKLYGIGVNHTKDLDIAIRLFVKATHFHLCISKYRLITS